MTEYENEKIKEYAGELPTELRRVIDALNSDIGLSIFFVLFKYGEMSFSQIMSELDIPSNHSSKLTYHIKKLQKSALVKNEYIKKENVGSYSFYDITEFGEGILNNLMNAILVPQSSNYPIQKLDVKLTSSSTERIINDNIRSQSAEILGKIRDRRAVESLIKRPEDTDSDVRTSSAEVLGKIEDSKVIEPIIKELEDTGSDVRASSSEDRGKIEDTDKKKIAYSTKICPICKKEFMVLDSVEEKAVYCTLKCLLEAQDKLTYRYSSFLETNYGPHNKN